MERPERPIRVARWMMGPLCLGLQLGGHPLAHLLAALCWSHLRNARLTCCRLGLPASSRRAPTTKREKKRESSRRRTRGANTQQATSAAKLERRRTPRSSHFPSSSSRLSSFSISCKSWRPARHLGEKFPSFMIPFPRQAAASARLLAGWLAGWLAGRRQEAAV